MNMTEFNLEDGSVTINGRHYTAEEYEALCERVNKHLREVSKP